MPALVAGIHVFSSVLRKQDMDGRDKPGHDSGAAHALSRGIGLLFLNPDAERVSLSKRGRRSVGGAQLYWTSLPSRDGAVPFKEEMMPGLRSKDPSLARRCVGLSAGGFAVCLTAVTLAPGIARAE